MLHTTKPGRNSHATACGFGIKMKRVVSKRLTSHQAKNADRARRDVEFAVETRFD